MINNLKKIDKLEKNINKIIKNQLNPIFITSILASKCKTPLGFHSFLTNIKNI